MWSMSLARILRTLCLAGSGHLRGRFSSARSPCVVEIYSMPDNVTGCFGRYNILLLFIDFSLIDDIKPRSGYSLLILGSATLVALSPPSAWAPLKRRLIGDGRFPLEASYVALQPQAFQRNNKVLSPVELLSILDEIFERHGQ